MKILVISHSNAIIGGATTSLIYLVKHLIALGCEVVIACNSRELADYLSRRSGARTVVWGGQPTHYGKVLSGWSQIRSFRALVSFVLEVLVCPLFILRQLRALKHEKPDIVHLNSCVLFHSAIAAKFAGLPLVWHIREGGRKILRRKIAGRFIQHISDAIICISPLEKDSFFLSNYKNVFVIYNPIDLEFFNGEKFNHLDEKIKMGYSRQDFLVLSLGGANPRKGPLEILQALQYTSSDVKFVFAGPPLPSTLDACGHKKSSASPYHQKIHALIDQYKDRVLFLGDVENIPAVIAGCEVLVFGGMTPHFPRPVYEAWIMKKVPIAFSVNGMSDNIFHGHDGFIVESHSPKDLADAILLLKEDKELYHTMVQHGYTKASGRMDSAKGAEDVLQIYRTLLA